MRNGLWLTAGCVAAILGSLLLVAYSLNNQHEQSKRNTTALRALCSLRIDLDRRIESSRTFLRENPNGIDGITTEVIRQSIANSQRTRRALAVLDCKENP